jgi:hypothetical protein
MGYSRMNDFKHTPGPWVVCPDLTTDYLFNIYDQDKNIVHDRNMEADANLIAAAPDLMDALDSIFNGSGMTGGNMDKARTALAKARGVS